MAGVSTSLLALRVALGLLMVVSIIELGFVSSTVGYLHLTASHGYRFVYNGRTLPLAGTPAHLFLDQGHTSNGAAGTGFILIGIGGFLALWLRGRAGGGAQDANSGFYYYNNGRSSSNGKMSQTASISAPLRGFPRFFYYTWLALQVPALLLTLGALAYVFALTKPREGQAIDPALAATLATSGSSSSAQHYPRDSWTPQNWFSAVLALDLVDGRADMETHLHAMRGWQYNLIPFVLVQLAETALAFVDFAWWRRGSISSHTHHLHQKQQQEQQLQQQQPLYQQLQQQEQLEYEQRQLDQIVQQQEMQRLQHGQGQHEGAVSYQSHHHTTGSHV
ncbi:hypothetical protein BX600DRAFT_459468 [Xylariales sp. PMI_506]|nr:hypothetical protein BX600DRAFT_459468 [Xylariales sp. PMI_506]